MESNLTDAIRKVFSIESIQKYEKGVAMPDQSVSLDGDLTVQIIQTFEFLKENLQQAEWTSFGEQMEQLDRYIQQLKTAEESE